MTDKLHGEIRTCMGFDLVREVRKNIYEEVTSGWRAERFKGFQCRKWSRMRKVQVWRFRGRRAQGWSKKLKDGRGQGGKAQGIKL